MTTFLQKTFLLGAVVGSMASTTAFADSCSNMGGFRVGIGLGVANGVSTQKVNTTVVSNVDSYVTGVSPSANETVTAGSLSADGASGGFLTIPNGTYAAYSFTATEGFLIGSPGSSSFDQVVKVNAPTATVAPSTKRNLGKVGLAGALNLEYWMYVGGSALVGFGVDVHNGTGYMNGSKDSSGGLSNSLLSTKIKTVWGVTPKLMFGLQLAPRTMLTFSVGASIDKYKTQSTFNTITPNVQSVTFNGATEFGGADVFQATKFDNQALGNDNTFTLPNTFSPKKFNKTKVGIQLGLGMRTIVAPNVELMMEGKATFGKAIKLNDDFTTAAADILPAETDSGTATNKIYTSSYNIKTMTQKFTMQKYELLVGVAYKFGGSDKASAAA